MVTRHSANGFMPISENGRWVTYADYMVLEEQSAKDSLDAERWRFVSSLKDVWAVLGDAYDLPAEPDGYKSLNDSIDATRNPKEQTK